MTAGSTTAATTIAAALRNAVRELEAHCAHGDWDQQPHLFALVPTSDLLLREPDLADRLSLDPDSTAGVLSSVSQELPPGGPPFEVKLQRISWPADVSGAAAVLERVVLPPQVETTVPDDPAEAERYAAEHEQRQEVRMAVGVLRGGQAHCVVRLRAHDDAADRLEGEDLVPRLVSLLAGSLELDAEGEAP